MKNFLIIFIGLIILATIVLFHGKTASSSPTTRLIIQLGQDLGKKYDMRLSGYGGKFDDGILLISLSFNKYGPGPTIEQARKLIINSLNEVISLVNENKELKPFLKTFPFTIENLDLDIGHFDEHGREIKPPYLVDVSAWEGDIIYRILTDPYGLKPIKEETYEEAVAILIQNDPKNGKP